MSTSKSDAARSDEDTPAPRSGWRSAGGRLIGGLLTGGRKGDVQGAATKDERNAEIVVPKMSGGRNDAIKVNENAPAQTWPSIENSLPLKLLAFSIGLV